MLRSMPVTLWRHILGDLWRLLLITTAVLVVVIAFSATIKPLADGKLQPVDALRFMMYAIPPMLAYALPFAACFAATLVYHRLAADNEAQAAAAGGVSHKSLLVPAAITGVVLFGAMAALNEEVIPRFLRSMQRLITADVSRVLLNSINRGEGVELGGKWIYADAALPIDPKPGSGVLQQLVLQRVVMLEVDGSGKTVLEGTAEKAFVVLHAAESTASGGGGRGNLRMSISPRKVVGRKSDGTLISNEVPLTVTVDVPDAFEDDPKFLTFGELRGLRDEPERMNWIDQRRRTLAVEIARVQSVNELSRMIRESGSAVLRDADGRRVEIKAAGLSHTDAGGSRVYEFAPLGGKVVVSRAAGLGTGGSAERFETESAKLVPVSSQSPGAGAVEFRLELDKPRTFSVGATEALAGARDRIVISGLTPAADPVDKLAGLGPEMLLKLSEALPATVETDLKPVKAAAATLAAKTADLSREITSKQHERMALAASCAVMVLTGAITALRLSLKLPLTVYLWSFFPALVSVVTIAGGQQMTHGTGNSGLFLLWGGVGMLALYSLLSLRVVARH